MKEYLVKNHASSLLPEGFHWDLAWADEFDGTELDLSKWSYRLSMMGKQHPAWTDRGVHLDGNSHAVFTLLNENGMPVSSQLQTGRNFMDEPVTHTTFDIDDLQWPIGKLQPSLYLHQYGYYECRCRLQQKEGWWSAFWVQSPIIGASIDPAESGAELDIMESFHPGEIAAHNAFSGGYGLDMKRLIIGGKIHVDPAEFHRFGMMWDESGYTFYIDGKEDGHIGGLVSKRPEFILISTEVCGYRSPEHLPVETAYQNIGDTFLVDYVRVFDRKQSE